MVLKIYIFEANDMEHGFVAYKLRDAKSFASSFLNTKVRFIKSYPAPAALPVYGGK